jgi:hypothetical protein
MMEETIKGRLAALRADFEAGERELVALEAGAAEMRRVLLRLSGAIQVLEELAAAGEAVPLAEATA